ncbi:SEL1-like repeat protein [Akkermansia glycaniphila]|uniref:GYF domain-containing protein n=1 Tax=Akkermansia glycaniphila TaxID=1679444 RepID=UPI001C01FE25|nr:GYF domain-containing protein [Akkermansia glycaniphila]MBT9448834.1 SEL1-like repeat protein [Akkermansia glycaniphila]
MKNYYYAKQGEDAQGPFSTDALKKLLRDGAIAAEDMVCEEGAEEWRTLASVFPPEKKWKEWMDKKVVVTGIVALVIGGGIGYALHPAGTASGKAGIAKNGIPVELKSEKARELYKKAMKGDPEAQCDLGALYKDGEDVDQSYPKSVMWYKKAAEQNYVRGLKCMAWFHQKGFGVKLDWEKAHEYVLRAAQLGDSEAMYDVAVDYRIGWGADENNEEFIKWATKAADAGNSEAMLNLAECYVIGMSGVSENLDLAEQWARKAQEGGQKDAGKVLDDVQRARDRKVSDAEMQRSLDKLREISNDLKEDRD